MSSIVESRRRILTLSAAAGMLVLPAHAKEEGDEKGGKDVGAVEDLMREHGVLRRALLVYVETVPALRSHAGAVDASALNRTAKLFRAFGEDYHERRLEEAYIFPRVRKAGGEASPLVDVLIEQHNRGRQITEYVMGVTRSGKIGTGDAEPLARAFETFVRMYQNHTAREDTIVFPAWKNALSGKDLDELGDQFEDIEKQQFGGDGFEKAVKEIGEIEKALGFADLAQFTAPPAP